MAFLRVAYDEHHEPLRGRTVCLRMPQSQDFEAWAALRALSRQHLTPWEPQWSLEDLSRTMWRRRLRAYSRDVRDDLAYPYFIFDTQSGALMGGITLSNVRRGAAQSAALGYWMGAPYAGQGRMKETVRLLMPAAFSTYRLHRVEAATMPANAASARVLESCGFEREGLARRYLKINGRWEDHVLYACVADQGPVPVR